MERRSTAVVRIPVEAVVGSTDGEVAGEGHPSEPMHSRRGERPTPAAGGRRTFHPARSLLFAVLVGLATSLPAPVASAAVATETIVLPRPEAGSFVTVIDYGRDGRLLVFDGFTVYVQERRSSSVLVPLGHLPEEFRGATDPAFVAASPDGRRLLLGAGAGGSRFPDPAFNGTIFEMSTRGGVARVLGTFPFSIAGEFRRPSEFFFGQGETFGLFTGSIQFLDLDTPANRSVVGNIPGDPGGLAFDPEGNLYVGLGAAQDPRRTGEIRRFDKHDVDQAVRGERLLDFDTDGQLIAQILNAGDLEMGLRNRLYVGGANFATGEGGYIAEIDATTGQVLRRFDPVDGDPDDGDFRFFELAFTRAGCKLAAADLLSFFAPGDPVLYEFTVCP